MIDYRNLTLNERFSIERGANDLFLIHGNNTNVFSKINDDLKGKIRCIYIDPPYNNGEVFKHYTDNYGLERWQKHMEDNLRIMKDFLTDDGSIWISIDDGHVHHLRLIGDSVFGVNNFMTTIIWQHRTSRENRRAFSINHEYLLVYAKKSLVFSKNRNLLPIYNTNAYKNPDNDPRGPWQSVTANVQDGHAVASQFYTIIAPNGKKHIPPSGRCWIYNEERMNTEIEAGNIWFGKTGNGVPRVKKFLSNSKKGTTPETIWLAEDVGSTQQSKKQLINEFGDNVFDTPKPVRLVERIFQIASDEGDIVMDSYLGSGTSAVAAYSLNRRFIGIEINDHIYKFAYNRLKKLIEDNPTGPGLKFLEE